MPLALLLYHTTILTYDCTTIILLFYYTTIQFAGVRLALLLAGGGEFAFVVLAEAEKLKVARQSIVE